MPAPSLKQQQAMLRMMMGGGMAAEAPTHQPPPEGTKWTMDLLVNMGDYNRARIGWKPDISGLIPGGAKAAPVPVAPSNVIETNKFAKVEEEETQQPVQEAV